jgi:endonuclease/exonuclease/phosphatase family metal-dependent hydrolase
MTFNIANAIGAEDDGENSWAGRAALNVDTILRQAPDLIGFQQLDRGNLETYAERLAGYERALGPPTDEEELHCHNAIYWKPDRLELLRSGGFYLSRTPDTWSRGWDAACVRGVTWARFRTHEGVELLHLNTHYDHIGETARVEGSKLMLRRMADLRAGDLPVLLTGDFNSNPWSPGYRARVDTTFTDVSYHIVRAAGFKDAFLEAGGEDSAASFTYHGFEGIAYWAAEHHMAGRIDWILTLDGRASVRTRTCAIVRDASPPVYPSDHYPVVAEVTLIA